MSRLGKIGWLVAGLAVAAAVAPSTAWSAAKSLVTITNETGSQSAQVTKGNQLLASEFNPASTVMIQGVVLDDDAACTPIYTVPTGRALVITKANYFVAPAPALAGQVALFSTPCETPFFGFVATEKGSGVTPIPQDFGTGFIVQSGRTINARAWDADCVLNLHGYLIPAAAAPSGSATTWDPRPAGGPHRDSPIPH